jgi:hypothetical protein
MAAAAAAAPFDAEKSARELTDRMVAELSLTAEQAPRVQQVNFEFLERLAPLAAPGRPSDAASRQARIQGALAATKTREQALRSTLTSTQWQMLKAKRIENVANLQTRMLEAQLGLTEAQVPRVDAINRDAAKAVEGILVGAGDLKEARALQKVKLGRDLKAEGSRRDEALKSVLTPPQFTTYMKNKEEMRELLKENLQQSRGEE